MSKFILILCCKKNTFFFNVFVNIYSILMTETEIMTNQLTNFIENITKIDV